MIQQRFAFPTPVADAAHQVCCGQPLPAMAQILRLQGRRVISAPYVGPVSQQYADNVLRGAR